MTARSALFTAALLFLAACDSGEPARSAPTTEDAAKASDDAVTAEPDAAAPADVYQGGPKKVDEPVDEPVTAEDPLTIMVDIGTVDMKLGISEPITLDVPEGAISVTLIVDGWPGIYYSADSVRGPDGDWLTEPGWLQAAGGGGGVCWGCPQRVSLSEQDYALLIPNSPTVSFEPGPYTVKLLGIDFATGAFSKESVNATAIVKFPPTGSGEGRLPLHFHFTGAGKLTALTALNDPVFKGAVDDMLDKLWQASVRPGQITYDDIGDGYRYVESTSGKGNDLAELFGLAQNYTGQDGVHIFVVDSIYAGEGPQTGIVLGIAGGIPGPPSHHGIPRSGVAVIANSYYLKQLGGILGGVMAHETGHFLGLFHSTESNGQGDPIPDTKTGDESNLMHWSSTGKGDFLTKGQTFVIQRNAILARP